MITIAIFKFLPVDENNIGRMNMLSAVEINIDENKSSDLYNDLILNGLFENSNLLESDYFLQVLIFPTLMLYSNKSLDEIKLIIETVVTKYIN